MGLNHIDLSQLTGLRARPLANLQKIHDDWVKELEKPLHERYTNKNGDHMETDAIEAIIKLFRLLIKEKS